MHHDWAVRVAQDVNEPLVTCEAVLAETIFHVGSAMHVLALLREGLARVDFDINSSQSRLEILAKRYADRAPDLADLCLICLSERFPSHPIITVDGDFRIYRRRQREAIPILMPS